VRVVVPDVVVDGTALDAIGRLVVLMSVVIEAGSSPPALHPSNTRYQGILDERPEHLLVRPRATVTSYGRYLTLPELQTLVDAAAELSPRHHAAVLTLAMTGLRVSELVNAKWRDLFQDPQGRTGLRVLGKGDKERVIRVRDDLLAVLSALHGSKELNAKDRTPLLPSSRGTAYSTRGVHELVAQATNAAEINKPVSPHWLRHTHATLAAAGGAPAVVIQASLGHARLETSQRSIHWARGLEETTVDSLPHLT
jgi:integrase/recombinase XerD